jgi:hypothetical protein
VANHQELQGRYSGQNSAVKPPAHREIPQSGQQHADTSEKKPSNPVRHEQTTMPRSSNAGKFLTRWGGDYVHIHNLAVVLDTLVFTIFLSVSSSLN